MSDEKETTLRISEKAVARIQEMARRVREVDPYYEAETSLLTAQSFASSMGTIFRLGGEIWAEGPDGDLSLGGRTEEGITYGVVAFPIPKQSRYPEAPAAIEWQIHS